MPIDPRCLREMEDLQTVKTGSTDDALFAIQSTMEGEEEKGSPPPEETG